MAYAETMGIVPTKHAWSHNITAAILTGQIAGLIMAVVVMLVFAVFLGRSPLFPVQVIGSFVLGDKALAGLNFPALGMGLLLHQLGPSLFWGLIFGFVAHKGNLQSRFGLFLLGLFIGLASQVVDVNLILPIAFTKFQGHNIWAEQVPVFWSWAAHIVYGLCLTLYPWVYKKTEKYFAR